MHDHSVGLTMGKKFPKIAWGSSIIFFFFGGGGGGEAVSAFGMD